MQANLLIGICAGLVSAVLFASASTGTMLGLFVLFFLSPPPIAIAGLGWGWRAAAVAAVAGAALIAVITSPRGALFHALALGAPTAILSYYCLLHRDVQALTGATHTEWYPIGRVVTLAAFLAGGLAAIGLLTTAPDMDGLNALLRGMLEKMLKPPQSASMPMGAPPALTPEQITGLTSLLSGLFTASLATMWFAIAMLNMWLAAHVVARSARLVRPWPDLSELRLPPSLPIALGAALAGTYLSGFPGLIAAGFASAILLAYVCVGLAIIHSLTRGQALRPMYLTATYAILFLFYLFVGPLLALLGLIEPFTPLRRKPPPQGPSST
jgi:hypothetical protein